MYQLLQSTIVTLNCLRMPSRIHSAKTISCDILIIIIRGIIFLFL